MSNFILDSFNPRTHSGCDVKAAVCNGWVRVFQSTHPLGMRPHVFWWTSVRVIVSIHAPTRDATLISENTSMDILFQSTHPLGMRLCADSAKVSLDCFNPRTHSGCDRVTPRVYLWLMEFQSTHPLGMRLPLRLMMYALW